LIEGLFVEDQLQPVRPETTEPLPLLPPGAGTAAVDTQLDAAAVQIGLLSGEIAGVANDLRIGLATMLRERAQVLELIGTLHSRPTFVPKKNVSAIAQAVFVAQARTPRA
jgi:hypothetical protein